MTRPSAAAALTAAAILAVPAAAQPDIVFINAFDNGVFTPFNANNTAVRYGDSGWITGSGAGDPVELRDITLGLAVAGPASAGFTDLSFTFNDGDPSGLIFGPGTELLNTTVTGLQLPEVPAGSIATLSVTIPLNGVTTSGGFNNIGWSVGVQNFNYNGEFGFQASSANGQFAGFYTNNASFFDGNQWSLFSFGPDPVTGVANFVAAVTVPAPGSAAIIGLAGIAAARRRR